MIIDLSNTQKLPCIFKVSIRTNQNIKIGIAVFSTNMPKTFYTYFKTAVNGSRVLDVRLPLCPQKGYLSIWNADATDSAGQNAGFEIVAINKLPLEVNPSIYNSKNQNLKNFVEFAKEFSESASYLSTRTPTQNRSIYKSDDGKFCIHYVDEIIGDDGKPRRTSMRVNNRSGMMEVAKKYILRYTIPERMAILLHEFSHFYLNKVHSDEFEADLNALMVYCGLGFPRQEGGTAFYKVFYRTPSDMNMERMKKIMNFLKNYDRLNFKILK